MCKLTEKDPSAKGNSVFAEVEDNRVFLEREVLKLRSNYKTVVQQLHAKVRQVSQLKVRSCNLG